ncbi:MAG: hypothetical protein NTV58_02310 [Deltaproteobacteria bacterium]|nr:hypothetical protein [Deltaproteobacteria bacterium]
MRKSRLLVVVFIICSIFLSFTGCAGNRDSRRDTTTIEDDYKSDRDIGREQDRERLDHGGY